MSLSTLRPQWSPTVVVGVDFGMTCTGVAYSSELTGWARPEVIQRWPDRTNGLFSKFPSRVGYDSDGKAIDWGRCNQSPFVVRKEKEFKLYLDFSFRDEFDEGLSHEDAVKYYRDYMNKLYQYVENTLMERFPNWQERDVEYRFSIPTTWKDPRLTGQLRNWLAEAGFVNTTHRRVIFSRTEAEAAAIYAARQYRQGDVVMVVDAGGATTDVNTLEVTRNELDTFQMLALDKAEGINIGSVMIDMEVRTLIAKKLKDMHVPERNGLKWIAEEMMEASVFEQIKCNFDKEGVQMNTYMQIPRDTQGRRVVLGSTELRGIFECLTQELINNMRAKILSLAQAHPNKQLRYIVLSGGLGSSRYIKQRLTEEFCLAPFRPPNTSNLQVLVAAEPQLAVVKGLVMDRSQALHHDLSIYSGEPTFRDPLTQTLWVRDQIDWLIREGEVVPEEGVLRPYSLRIPRDRVFETFCAYIVMSALPARDLPRSKHRGPVTRLCKVKGIFTSADRVNGDFQPVRNPFRSRRDHDIAHFNLKVNVGSTDIGFEFVSLDGQSYSREACRASVAWNYAKPSTSRRDSDDADSSTHLDQIQPR